MQKSKPYYDLEKMKLLISQKAYFITRTAKNNALKDFSLSSKDILKYIMKLDRLDFYKAMTSHLNHEIWQDVYHYKINSNDEVYIKLQMVNDETIIIQFKMKE